jgi:hypothetical protein
MEHLHFNVRNLHFNGKFTFQWKIYISMEKFTFQCKKLIFFYVIERYTGPKTTQRGSIFWVSMATCLRAGVAVFHDRHIACRVYASRVILVAIVSVQAFG